MMHACYVMYVMYVVVVWMRNPICLIEALQASFRIQSAVPSFIFFPSLPLHTCPDEESGPAAVECSFLSDRLWEPMV